MNDTPRRKILLVKPPYRHLPLGLAYVLACLEQNDIPFDFIDTCVTKPNYRKLFRNNNYLAFAIGGLISNREAISETIRTVRTLAPDLPIIMGGNITRDVSPDILFDRELMGMDFGIIGEAETSLPFLIEALRNGSKDFRKVPGLLYKDKESGEVIRNSARRFDLTAVNVMPAWHHIDTDLYKYTIASYLQNKVVMSVITGRGCVGTCTFCSPTVGAFRKRPLEHIMEEIEFLFSHYEFDILNFLNEMFYDTNEDILRFCHEYKKLSKRKAWMCGMRVDVKGLDVETFRAMKDCGCILASGGIESGSNRILEKMKKRTTKEQVIRFYRGAKEAKLPCFGSFIVGNEDETEEELKETIDMVIEEDMIADGSLCDAYPGTRLYKAAVKSGLIKDERKVYKELNLTPRWHDWTWVNRDNYVNISAIPNDRFWQVISGQMRRFYTHLYKKYPMRNPKAVIDWLFGAVKAQGECPKCGTLYCIDAELDLLGQCCVCPNCFATMYLDYYHTDGFAGYYEKLCDELRNGKSLVVVGVQREAMNIMQFDHFGVDYGAIAGFLDLEGGATDHPFLYLPRLSLNDLKSLKPEKLLIADDRFCTAEMKLKNFYEGAGLAPPRILNIIPSAVRRRLAIAQAIDHSPAAIRRTLRFMLIALYSTSSYLPGAINIVKITAKRTIGVSTVSKLMRWYRRVKIKLTFSR